MPVELCPSCRVARNMAASVSRRTILAPDGRKKTIRITSFHCGSCGQFVRSEEAEELLAGRSNAAKADSVA